MVGILLVLFVVSCYFYWNLTAKVNRFRATIATSHAIGSSPCLGYSGVLERSKSENKKSISFSVKSDFLQPHGLWPTRLCYPWNSPDWVSISFSKVLNLHLLRVEVDSLLSGPPEARAACIFEKNETENNIICTLYKSLPIYSQSELWNFNLEYFFYVCLSAGFTLV